MAVKTITIDLAAYEALARRKRVGESFSDVIKAHFARTAVARDLLVVARRIGLEPGTLEGIDKVVSSRKRSRARTPQL